MRETEKKKPVKTLPESIWESSKPVKKPIKGTPSTDLQGNGYPVNKMSK